MQQHDCVASLVGKASSENKGAGRVGVVPRIVLVIGFGVCVRITRERLLRKQQQPKWQAGRWWRASELPPAAPRPEKPCAPAGPPARRSMSRRSAGQGRGEGQSEARAAREDIPGVEVEVQEESSAKISGSPGTLGSKPALLEAPENRVSGTTVRT